MIRSQKSVLTQFMVLGALLLLSVTPSRSFMVPLYAKRLPSPLHASTTSDRINTAGDLDTTSWDGRFGVPIGSSSVAQDERVRAATLETPFVDNALKTAISAMPENPPLLVYGETAGRSFVKALVWRLTAAVVTLVSGLVVSGSLTTAMSIVGSDFVTKSGSMFLGERLWNRVKWGQGKSGDNKQRSLAKAMLWRLFAASNTLVCGVFLARDLSVASRIAGTDTFFKTGLFFVNERIWSAIKWGKKYEPEYSTQ